MKAAGGGAAPDPSGLGRRAKELGRRRELLLSTVPGIRADRPDPGLMGSGPDRDTPPSWLLLPVRLYDAWADATADPSDLDDILWAQYALFLHVRIVDDVFDGHAGDPGLHFVADRFLIASLEAFQAKAELDVDFWELYRSCLRRTVDGILEVHELEREPGAFTADRLELHAHVSSIFKIGAAAVCHLLGRPGEAAWIGRLQDRAAIFGQLLDDLVDVGDDLDARRFTFVANELLRLERGDAAPEDEIDARLREGLLLPSRARRIWDTLARLADEAAAAVPPSAPDAVQELARALEVEAQERDSEVHRARIRWILGEEVAAGETPPA